MNTDRIEREITIKAPIERVWAALTEPDSIGTWFGTGEPAEIDLRPGGVMAIDHGRHGRFRTLIVDVEPPSSFSYRWASAYPEVIATEVNSTLVEFTLEAVEGGTVLRVVESGFDELLIPADRVEEAGFESHSKGWTGVMQKLGDYAEGADLTPLLSQP